jgi:hypothetical protein
MTSGFSEGNFLESRMLLGIGQFMEIVQQDGFEAKTIMVMSSLMFLK